MGKPFDTTKDQLKQLLERLYVSVYDTKNMKSFNRLKTMLAGAAIVGGAAFTVASLFSGSRTAFGRTMIKARLGSALATGAAMGAIQLSR
jgi:hypothetical protein